MRKLIILGLMAATALPAAAAEARTTRNELRRDRQDVREERRELRQAIRHGDRRDVREERGEYRDARRELREDRRDFRQHRRGYTYYQAPYRSWSYRPVYSGYHLQPSFYGSRYHYSGYRPQGYARWIRYGDDLLLVNTRNGRVIQVRHNYFW